MCMPGLRRTPVRCLLAPTRPPMPPPSSDRPLSPPACDMKLRRGEDVFVTVDAVDCPRFRSESAWPAAISGVKLSRAAGGTFETMEFLLKCTTPPRSPLIQLVGSDGRFTRRYAFAALTPQRAALVSRELGNMTAHVRTNTLVTKRGNRANQTRHDGVQHNNNTAACLPDLMGHLTSSPFTCLLATCLTAYG